MTTLSKKDQKSKISQAEADRRRAVALAKLRELELAEKQGTLLERKAVESAWFEGSRIVRDGLLAIPDRLSSLLASISDPHKIHQLLDTEIRKALNEIASAVAQIGH